MYVQNKTILKETMKPKPNRSLSLPWTPQREKTSGNHLLRRKKNATSLTSPIYIYAVYITISRSNVVLAGVLYQFFDLADSRKYLYQLSSTCEQNPISKKQHLYERKSHQTRMADILEGSTNSYPGSRFIGRKCKPF